MLSKKTSTSNKDGGLILPQNWRSPLFYRNWPQTNGMGLKKKTSKDKKWKRPTIWKKQSIQPNSNNRINFVKSKSNNIPHFINKPLNNFDLLNWVKKLGIKHFRGIYSRDALPDRIKRNEVGIINLDSQIGPGTHWVAYRNKMELNTLILPG